MPHLLDTMFNLLLNFLLLFPQHHTEVIYQFYLYFRLNIKNIRYFYESYKL
jgi:hypothetical protein